MHAEEAIPPLHYKHVMWLGASTIATASLPELAPATTNTHDAQSPIHCLHQLAYPTRPALVGHSYTGNSLIILLGNLHLFLWQQDSAPTVVALASCAYTEAATNMASQQPQKPQGSGLPNPYAKARLPNPYAAATVASAAPVRYTEEQAKAEQQKKAPGIYLMCSTFLP